LFDRVLIVDWSAANTPTSARNQANAIWIGATGEGDTGEHHFCTRSTAELHIAQQIARAREGGFRLLIGFDFAFGYPAGFAQILTGQASAKAVWHWLVRHVTDTDRNANNRFDLANRINTAMGGAGPFWSHPAGRSYSALHPTKAGIDHVALGFAEYRTVERHASGAKSVFMLNNPGAVASQSLLGLPMIHRLSQGPDVAVWPFDPVNRPIVLAEVYPSLLARPVMAEIAAAGIVKDRAQVRLLARSLHGLGRTGRIAPLFSPPDAPTEEGWILGAGHQVLLHRALTA
jgi:hypothetical protein